MRSADIRVTVTQVQEQELPELDDEFAQTASEFDSLDELRDDVAARLANAGRLDQAAKARDAVLENLLAQLEIDLPENVIGTEIEARKTQIQSQLDSASIDLDEYLAETGEAEDAESFWAGVEKRSADALKAQLVLDKTAEETEVSVDQNDLTQHIFQRAQQEGTAPQQIIAHMQEHPHHIDEYMLEIRRGKALAVIVEAATVTDSNGDVVELARIQPDGSLGDPAGRDRGRGRRDGRVRRRRDRVPGDRRVRGRDQGLIAPHDAQAAKGPRGTPLGPLSLAVLGKS